MSQLEVSVPNINEVKTKEAEHPAKHSCSPTGYSEPAPITKAVVAGAKTLGLTGKWVNGVYTQSGRMFELKKQNAVLGAAVTSCRGKEGEKAVYNSSLLR